MGTDKKMLVVNEKGTIEIDTVSGHSNGTKHLLHHALTAILVVTAVVLFAATFHVIRQRVITGEEEDFNAQQISLNENYVTRQHSSAPDSVSSTIASIQHRNDEEKDIGKKPDVQASTDATETFSRVSVGNRRLVGSRKVRDVDDHDEEELDDSPVTVACFFRRRARRSTQTPRRPEHLSSGNVEVQRSSSRFKRDERILRNITVNFSAGAMRIRDRFGRHGT